MLRAWARSVRIVLFAMYIFILSADTLDNQKKQSAHNVMHASRHFIHFGNCAFPLCADGRYLAEGSSDARLSGGNMAERRGGNIRLRANAHWMGPRAWAQSPT